MRKPARNRLQSELGMTKEDRMTVDLNTAPAPGANTDHQKASTRLRGFLRRPTHAQLHDTAAKEGMVLRDEDVVLFDDLFEDLFRSLDRVSALLPDEPERRWTARTVGSMATAATDPFNAVVRWCDIAGAASGSLAGVRIGVKDNIAVAGVPISNGSRTASHSSTHDALAVERLLDAGGRVVAKTNLDDYSALGTGESSWFGPALNPHDTHRSAGGSSGGSGSAVASGLVDLALAVDQGGSARIPASFNGVVTLKASHGRIPSFGVTHIDHTLDCISPVARTVAEVAAAVDVLSGPDNRDPQWQRATPVRSACVDALDRGVAGLTVAVVEEGVDPGFCTPDVLAAFAESVAVLEGLGATVVRISIPLWREAWNIEQALLAHMNWAMASSDGIGWNSLGYVDTDRAHAYALSRRLEADEYSASYKLWLLAGRYLTDNYFTTVMAHAMNLRWTLERQIEEAFGAVDALIMPTTPHVASELLDTPSGEAKIFQRGTTMVQNTTPTNLAGNPSLAMPNGRGEKGLPTSIQIVTAHGADELAISIGAALEAEVGTFPPAHA